MPDLQQPSPPRVGPELRGRVPRTALRHTPVEVDSFRPSAARMYDYYLGGTHHLAADREAADALLAAVPDVAAIAKANRSFQRRVIEYASANGVDQFLDLGAGFPLAGGVSDVALAANPKARVVSVDIDPGVVASIQAAISADGLGGRVGAVHADLRDAPGVLEHPVTRRLLDLDRPVAVLFLSVLHFVGGDLGRVFDPLRKAMAGGSLLALTHATAPAPGERATTTTDGLDQATIVRLIYDCTLTPISFRTTTELDALLTGLSLVAPGLVPIDRWRAEAAGPLSVRTLSGAVAHVL
jgi:hypothetical protein